MVALLSHNHNINCLISALKRLPASPKSFYTRTFTSSIMDVSLAQTIKRAAEVIHDARAILVTAGAGIGVDSGLPDFRGPEGFWRAYPPLKKLGLTLPEMSTPRWFWHDPKFAWGFFGHRIKLYRETNPHNGFNILKKWAESKSNRYFVYTSNVDGHFQKAGFPSEKVVECHGSLNFLQCVSGRGSIWPNDLTFDIDDSTLTLSSLLPMGPPGVEPEKRQLARPNVLMFDDRYFISSRTDEQEKRFNAFFSEIISMKIPFTVIEIGAGLAVPTIRWHGEDIVRSSNLGCLIRINPTDSDIPSKKHISVPLGGLEALEKIDAELEKLR